MATPKLEPSKTDNTHLARCDYGGAHSDIDCDCDPCHPDRTCVVCGVELQPGFTICAACADERRP